MVMDLQNRDCRSQEDEAKIKLMCANEKNLFLEDIVSFNLETNILNTSIVNIDDVFNVFIISDDFNNLDNKKKIEVLKSFNSLKRLLMNVEVFCIDNELGRYAMRC